MRIINELRKLYPDRKWKYDPSFYRWYSDKDDDVHWVSGSYHDDDDFPTFSHLYLYRKNGDPVELASAHRFYHKGRVNKSIIFNKRNA